MLNICISRGYKFPFLIDYASKITMAGERSKMNSAVAFDASAQKYLPSFKLLLHWPKQVTGLFLNSRAQKISFIICFDEETTWKSL